MRTMLVTCPEAAHLAEIEYEDHPLGMLVVGCSQFSPTCAVTCSRRCAAMLDQKRRGQGNDDDTVVCERPPFELGR